MSRDSACIFCKIVTSEVPALVVFRDDHVIALMDINPLAEGHLLVIPKDHSTALVDLSAEQFSQMSSVAPLLGRALMDVTGAEGFNLLVNNGESAGQVVPHVHMHLIPRRTGDNLGYRWPAKEYEPGRADELARAYEKTLNQLGG